MALFSSCKSYTVLNYALDFSEANKQGVFVTQAPSVSFDYVPVGCVKTYIESGFDSRKGQQKKDFYGNESGSLGEYHNANSEDALNELVQLTKDLGGNGIIGIIFEYLPNKVIASGMAIKKK